MACDYTKPAGLEVAHALVSRADVVVASFKPSDENKLKLDYTTLAAINPGLIYGQITAMAPMIRAPDSMRFCRPKAASHS